MKKLLTVSLVAMMAVSAARADIASTTYVDSKTGNVSASTYVSGLVNKTLTGAVENLDSRIEAISGESGILAELDLDTVTAAGKPIVSVSQENGKVAAAFGEITNAGIAANAGIEKSKLASDVQASLGKADTAMQSIGDGTVTKTMLDSTVQASLGKADTAMQSIGDGTVTKTMLDSTVQASLGKADTAMQSIGDGTVTKTMLDSGVQTSLGKADTAVQPAAITDMQEKSLMVSDNNEYNAATDKTAVYPSASYMIAAIEGAQSDLNSDIQKAQETADANALAIENLDGTYLTDSEFATFKTSNSGAIAAAQKAGDDAQADLDAYQESNDAALAGVKATAEAAVVANSAITAGTGSVITYDAKGLVTSGRALVASDIPTIEQSQVNGLGASLTGATNAALQGIADATTGVTDGVWTLTMKVAGDTTTFGWEEISR